MTVEEIQGVRGTVAGWDPSTVDRAGAGGVARAMVDLAAEVARRQVLVLLQAQAVGLLAGSGARDVAGWLRAQGVAGRSARTLGDAVRGARDSALVRHALEAGRVAIDAVAELRPVVDLVTAGRCPEAELTALLDRARHERVEALRHAVRAVVLRIAQDDPAPERPPGQVFESTVEHGQCQLRSVLDPEDHVVVRNAIDHVVDEQWRAGRPAGTAPSTDELPTLRARALVELARRSLRGTTGTRGTPRASTAEVVVLVDDETFLTGFLRPDSTCRLADGSPVPVTVAHRLAIEAGLRCATRRADGTIGLSERIRIEPISLDHGRTRRLASAEQRLALTIDHTTCAVFGCTVPIDRCKAHHRWYWEHGGPTDLANLVPLCQHHHHLVHDRGWRLVARADGRSDLVPPRADAVPPVRRRRTRGGAASGTTHRSRVTGGPAAGRHGAPP